MNTPDPFEHWKTIRSNVEADTAFVDRVMERIGPLDPPELSRRWTWRPGSSYAAAAMILLAVGLSLARIGVVIGLILGFPEQGF